MNSQQTLLDIARNGKPRVPVHPINEKQLRTGLQMLASIMSKNLLDIPRLPANYQDCENGYYYSIPLTDEIIANRYSSSSHLLVVEYIYDGERNAIAFINADSSASPDINPDSALAMKFYTTIDGRVHVTTLYNDQQKPTGIDTEIYTMTLSELITYKRGK